MDPFHIKFHDWRKKCLVLGPSVLALDQVRSQLQTLDQVLSLGQVLDPWPWTLSWNPILVLPDQGLACELVMYSNSLSHWHAEPRSSADPRETSVCHYREFSSKVEGKCAGRK